MSKVLAFKIRKPWYIILEHAQSEDKIVRDVITDTVVTSLNHETIKLSDEEETFNSTLKIEKYEEFFEITDQSTNIGISILKYWINYVYTKDIDYKSIFLNQFAGGNKKQEADRDKFIEGQRRQAKSKFRQDVDLPIVNYSREEIWSATSKKSRLQKHSTSNIYIPKSLALVICNIAILRLEEQINDSKDESIIEKLKKDLETVNNIKEIINNEQEEYSETSSEHKKFWFSTEETIPPILHDSRWICYERTDGTTNKEGSWGIAQSFIYIETPPTNSENHTVITMTSKYDETEYLYEGILTFDSESGYLVAQLKRKAQTDATPATPSFFVLPVNDADHQSILIGYHLYYSIYYRRFLTKTVIWENTKGNVPAKDLSCSDLLEFDNIKKSIRRFLFNRSQNRLTHPSTPISNLDEHDLNRSLHSWVAKRSREVERDYLLKACVGTYDVCFFYGNPTKALYNSGGSNISIDNYIAAHIRVDQLEISFDDNEVEFNAEFIHSEIPYEEIKETEAENQTDTTQSVLSETPAGTDSNLGENQQDTTQGNLNATVFKGKVRRFGTTVEIMLEGDEKNLYKTTEANYILLNFCLPSIQKGAVKKVINGEDYFQGIATGINDENNMPISFRTLVVQRRPETKGKGKSSERKIDFEKKGDRSVLEKQIIQYFRRNLQQNQIKILPKGDSFSDKYPSIHLFTSKGGRICMSQGKNNDSSQNTVHELTCLSKEGQELNSGPFLGSNEDEAFKNADQWLLDNIIPIAEDTLAANFPNIQQLRAGGGELSVKYSKDLTQNRLLCEVTCIDKNGVSATFSGQNEWEATQKLEEWLSTYFSSNSDGTGKS